MPNLHILILSLLFLLHLRLVRSKGTSDNTTCGIVKQNITLILPSHNISKTRVVGDVSNKLYFTNSLRKDDNNFGRRNIERSWKRSLVNRNEMSGDLDGSIRDSQYLCDEDPHNVNYYSFSKSLDDVSKFWSNIYHPGLKVSNGTRFPSNIFLSTSGADFDSNSENKYINTKNWSLVDNKVDNTKVSDFLTDSKGYLYSLNAKASEVEDECKPNKFLRFISSFGGVFGKVEPSRDGIINFSSPGSYDEQVMPKSNLHQDIKPHLVEGIDSHYYRGANSNYNKDIWSFKNNQDIQTIKYPTESDYYLPQNYKLYEYQSGQTKVETDIPSAKSLSQKDIFNNKDYEWFPKQAELGDRFNLANEFKLTNNSPTKKLETLIDNKSNDLTGFKNSSYYPETKTRNNESNYKKNGPIQSDCNQQKIINSKFVCALDKTKVNNYSASLDDKSICGSTNITSQTDDIGNKQIFPQNNQLNPLSKNDSSIFQNQFSEQNREAAFFTYSDPSYNHSKQLQLDTKYLNETPSSFHFLNLAQSKKGVFGRTTTQSMYPKSLIQRQKFEPIIMPEYEKINNLNVLAPGKFDFKYSVAGTTPIPLPGEKNLVGHSVKQFRSKFSVNDYVSQVMNYAGNHKSQQADKTTFNKENNGFLAIPLENHLHAHDIKAY